ncbi:hypothetical protein NQ176_g357 [Zarea fungicola]|uniref:Uncharacterized protein n=1 Tax=Zarea fungicola TaxID=93591 RepID=A0ACC1NXM7_9HYPO|nr:hypothetical protein NQ176_g357 [Lecanicillium fungicola]
MTQKPLILFVHGAWHTKAHYADFINLLQTKGYTVIAPDLPSSLEPSPPNPTEADIKLFADTARDLADQGNEIVVVSHSYGALISTEAFTGLGLSSRNTHILPGGIRTHICIAGFLLGPGMTLEAAAPLPSDGLGWASYEGEYKVLNHSHDIGAMFYPDLPKEEQEKWLKLLVRHPKASSFYEPKSFSYMEIETVFVSCEMDMAFPYGAQKALIEGMQSNGVNIREETLPSGHFPNLIFRRELASNSEVLLTWWKIFKGYAHMRIISPAGIV